MMFTPMSGCGEEEVSSLANLVDMLSLCSHESMDTHDIPIPTKSSPFYAPMMTV